jgi:hypothetical protein
LGEKKKANQNRIEQEDLEKQTTKSFLTNANNVPFIVPSTVEFTIGTKTTINTKPQKQRVSLKRQPFIESFKEKTTKEKEKEKETKKQKMNEKKK